MLTSIKIQSQGKSLKDVSLLRSIVSSSVEANFSDITSVGINLHIAVNVHSAVSTVTTMSLTMMMWSTTTGMSVGLSLFTALISVV